MYFFWYLQVIAGWIAEYSQHGANYFLVDGVIERNEDVQLLQQKEINGKIFKETVICPALHSIICM